MSSFLNNHTQSKPLTSVSAAGLVGGFFLNRTDSGLDWWLWRDPAAAGFRRTRETLGDIDLKKSD